MKFHNGQSGSLFPHLSLPGKKWFRTGHPWLYRTHLASETSGPTQAGFVWTEEGAYAFSPLSEIRLRRAEALDGLRPTSRWSDAESAPIPTDASEGLKSALRDLWNLKRRLVDGDECFRWIFSEADGWPGLVVDVFGDQVVAQIQTAPMESSWTLLAKVFVEAASEALGRPATLRELRATPARKREGLDVVPLPAAQEGEGEWYRWNGLDWWFHPGRGQKTGAYLDQRSNHLAAAEWARRFGARAAWDVFSFEGGFGLHLAKAGLKVECVDQSSSALGVLGKNAERNGLAPLVTRTEANAFDWLKARSEARAKTDLVVLDPPSFVRNRKDKESALRGFKEINLRGFQALKPGGILVSCSCSHHIRPEDYAQMLAAAAHDAKRRCRVLEVRGPSPDHSPRLGFAESEYLQGWYVEVQSG